MQAAHSDSVFPTEVYERIIDYFGQAFDVPFLRACALVSRSWYPRARFHLLRSIQLHSKTDVLSFTQMVRRGRGPMGLTNVAGMVERMMVRGTEPNATPVEDAKKETAQDVPRVWVRRSLVHLGTCAAMLAGRAKLDNLTYLGIADGEWRDMHRNVGSHLSAAFPKVRRVDLFNVKFRSTADLGRFLCAFNSLVHVGFWVSSRGQGALQGGPRTQFNPDVFMHTNARRALQNLRKLTLNGQNSTRELGEYLLATGVAGQLDELWIGYYERVPLAEVVPLISAATSLLGLDITVENIVGSQGAATPKEVVLDLAPNTQLRILMLRLQPGNIYWLHELLQRVSAKTIQGITIILDVRRPLLEDTTNMRDMIQQSVSLQLCTSIDELFCSFEEQPDSADTLIASSEPAVEEMNLPKDESARRARPPRYRYGALRIVQLALWVRKETVQSVYGSEEWTALMRARFPLLRARNMLMTAVVLEDSTDFLHEK